MKLEKQRGERAQKEKEILQSFDCFFKTSSTAMPAPHHPQQRCWGLGHPLGEGVSLPQLRPSGEGAVKGKSARELCSFSLSMKSNDFSPLCQPNPSQNSSRLGIWAPESARFCLLSSFLFILFQIPGFYTPLSPSNHCPPRLCQIWLFPRT